MAALDTALQRAREGNGQVVGVVGEAGVGKSRLCLEFVERVRAKDVPVYEAHCPSHGKAIPFLPFFELLRGYFGVSAQDSDATVRQKIAGRLLLLDRSLDEILPVIFEFLGVPDSERPAPSMDPEARQRQLFGLVRRLVQDRRLAEPVVILVDDLHWIDSGSDAFLDQLVEATSGTRTLLLVNFRPEYHANWMGKSYYQQLPLVPLGPEAVEELLGDLLGDDPSLADLPDLIRARTGGNPFFIEEVVQSLMESGSLAGARGAYRLARLVTELEIPATVHSLLAGRIDRLAEREKQVLQTAAVLGKKFSEPVLKQVIELPDLDLAASLDTLQRSEFVYEEALYPTLEYAFKHALTQEVAYASQLTERRKRTHTAAARAIVALYPDKQDEQAALLAHHWEEAGEALEAARWHARAAGWVGYSDVAESLRHWQRVHKLVERLPETDEATSLRLLACVQILQFGWRLGVSQAEADALFAEGKALAARQGDPRAAALLAISYAARVGTLGNTQAYVEHAIEAARLAKESGDLELRCISHLGLAHSHWLAGRLMEALGFIDRGFELLGEERTIGIKTVGFSAFIWLVSIRGILEGYMGELEAGRRDLDRGIELAREINNAENLGWGLGSCAVHAALSGEPGNARAQALESLEIAEKLGSAHSLATALAYLGVAQLLHEEWQEAIDALEQALEIARSRRTRLDIEALMLANLARAYLGVGQVDKARQTAEDAVEAARQRGKPSHEIQAQLSLARVLLTSVGAEGRPAIEEALTRALELVEATGAKALEPQILVERAELARLLEDEATRKLQLREAHRLFAEMGATGHAKRLGKKLEL
jgi:adenylate cyclase